MKLLGGFNPFENITEMEIFPKQEVNIKKSLKPPPRYIHMKYTGNNSATFNQKKKRSCVQRGQVFPRSKSPPMPTPGRHSPGSLCFPNHLFTVKCPQDPCMVQCIQLYIYIYTYIYIYMRVVLKSFIWKTPSSPKKNLSPNFRELHVYLSRYMLAKIFKKNMDVTMCDILKLFQASDPLSHFILRPLHLNIYVLL